MNITYDYYKIFYYAAKYGSFTKAAQLLKSSQPNVTRAMNNLEAQLGVELFVRSKKGIKLNENGEKLFERISVAVEQINIAEAEMESEKVDDEGMVIMGVSDIAMYEILYPRLPELRKEFPKIAIRITNMSTNMAISSLKEGLIDFALVSSPLPEGSFYEKVEIKSFREYPVVSKDYKEYDKKDTSIKSFVKYPIIMLATGTSTRAFYDDIFAKNGVELNPDMTASNVNQVISMAKAGLGIGFVPESILDIDDTFIKINIKEYIPERKLYLAYNNDKIFSGAANSLIRRIKRQIRELKNKTKDISK